MKTALITGITGQDGAYLAALLLEKGYRVFGTYRRSSASTFWRIRELGIANHAGLHFVEYDLADSDNSIRLVEQTEPDEIYNLAAQSCVGLSFEQPETTAQITGLGALRLLEAVRRVNPSVRFYQAGTSEMFGKAQEVPQTESTPFHPCSPYGVAKLNAHWLSVIYRENYNIFASNGILFNHESPLRGIEFVTRKITDAFARMKLGRLDCLELGNLDTKRDWGYAREYVDGIWRILQHHESDTFILATGRDHSIRDFVNMTARAVDMELEWRGKGIEEVGIEIRTGRVRVRVNPRFYRPAEVDHLIGNAAKAYRELGWKASKTLEELCLMMLEADLRRHR